MRLLPPHPPLARVARILCLVVVAAALASCGGDRPAAPTGPAVRKSIGSQSIASRISEEVAALLEDKPRLKQSSQHFLQVQGFVSKGDIAGARNMVRIMDAELLQQFNAGGLVDPDGVGGKAVSFYLAQLLGDLDAYVGLSTAPENYVPGPDAVVFLVNPSPTEQIFPVTYNGIGDEGAVFIVPPNATTTPAFLTIDRSTTGASIPPELTGGLSTLSKLYEVHFSPAISFSSVIFGVCILPPNESFAGSARLAHQVSATQVDILPLVQRYYVCDNDGSGEIGMNEPRGGVESVLFAARHVAHRAWSLFAPSVAFAGHAAILGSVSTLSPFQVVSTATDVSATVGVEGNQVSIDASLTKRGLDASYPGQTLTLIVDGEPRATGTTNSDGHVLFVYTESVAGTHNYVVKYAGSPDGVWAGSQATGSFYVYGSID